MYNDYMYAIDRSDEYLEHYGIKGMRWGVRKAIERGGTGLGNRRLARQYRKAQKKLAKLEKRANSGAKYARRAAALGAGAAAAGGLAALGTGGISRGIMVGGTGLAKGSIAARKGLKGAAKAAAAYGSHAKSRVGAQLAFGAAKGLNAASNAAGKMSKPLATGTMTAAGKVTKWGNNTSVGNAIANKAGQAQMRLALASNKTLGIGNKVASGSRNIVSNTANKLRGVSNNTIARAGAAALGAGLAGAAGYNAYRAATTKRAAKKAADFRKEMNKTFAGTAYGKQGGSKKRRRRA